MPGTDGLAFLQAVRDEYPEMPFILYTGHGSEEIASEAISAGVTEYMQKETGTDQYTVLANTIVNAVEHARAEDALRESEERYRTVVEQSHDGIYIYRGRQFEFLNDRICEITGYDKEMLYGMDIFELIHPEDRERVAGIAERRRAGEDAPNRYQARIVTESGETRYLEFSVESITYEGAYAGMGSVRDVTERRHREERLDEFASIVAHDLRNPLNVLAGRLNLVRETGDDTHFDAMERSVDTMEALLEDMRDLARLGMPVQETGIVDVAAVARTAWETVEGVNEATLDLAEDLPIIEADEDRLERLLVECFENAVAHADLGVVVRVEATADGFTITDDGPGIDEPDRAFKAGYTTDPDRTGFGLAIVEWVADAHGWDSNAIEPPEGGARIEISGIEHM
jgi:PAS domain S-box-containing protein